MSGQPIQGFDVTVSVMGPNGPEFVGEFQEISINLKHDPEEYMTLNSRLPQLLEGDIKIEGKLKKGWFSVAILSRVWGQTSLRPNEPIRAQKRFNIECTVNAPTKGLTGRIKLENVLLNDIGLNVKGGKAVVEKDLGYRAEGISEAA